MAVHLPLTGSPGAHWPTRHRRRPGEVGPGIARRRTRLRAARLLRRPWLLAALATFAAALGLIAPLRVDVTAALTRALLFVIQPLEPSLKGFAALPATTTVRAADGTVLAHIDGSQDRQPVSLASLPPQVPEAVLAAEDAEFYREAAVNPLSIMRAAYSDASGSNLEGGSTITQQLAKINFLGSRRTLARKLQEVLYADELSRRYSKRQLLERYLNQVYFGDGAYGISAAAHTFFDESPQQLTPAQAAMLAGKIRAPETLDPFAHPKAVAARRDEVLHTMAQHGWLSADQLRAALSSPLGVRHPAAASPEIAPEFVDYVSQEAKTLDALGPDAAARARAFSTGGYTIYTTLDTRSYRAAAAAAADELGAPGDPDTAAVSITPGDGAIRDLFAGLGYRAGGFDPATQGAVQAGSAFKPFVYLAALQDGIDPRSVLPAYSPMTITYRGAQYSLHNYEPGAAATSIDDALARSINTVFVQLAVKVGPPNVARIAEAAGLPQSITADAYNPSLALGAVTHGVSPLQMADAYATIAAGGVWAAPYSITRIVDRTGRVIYQHAPRTHPALDPRDVAVLTNAMQGVVQYGTGVAANIGRPLAGKTGTTDNFADAWFIGFVPQLTTAVWVGYADSNHPMKDVHGIAVTGGTFPASIFARVMGPALAGQPVYPLTTASPDTLALVPYYDVPNADGSGAWHPGYATGNANAPASGSVAGAASNATGSTGATDPSTTTTSSSTPAQSSTAQSSTASSSTTSSSTTSTSQPSSSSTSTTAAGGNSTSNTGSGGSGGSGAGSGSTSSGGGSTTTTTAPSG